MSNYVFKMDVYMYTAYADLAPRNAKDNIIIQMHRDAEVARVLRAQGVPSFPCTMHVFEPWLECLVHLTMVIPQLCLLYVFDGGICMKLAQGATSTHSSLEEACQEIYGFM